MLYWFCHEIYLLTHSLKHSISTKKAYNVIMYIYMCIYQLLFHYFLDLHEVIILFIW